MNATAAVFHDPLVDRVVGDQRVARPARALFGVNVLGLLWQLYTLVAAIASLVSRVDMPHWGSVSYRSTINGVSRVVEISVEETPIVFIVTSLLQLAVGAFILVGLRRMQVLRSRWFATAATVIGMIPFLGSAWPLAIPFGLWALFGLLSPSAKRWFS